MRHPNTMLPAVFVFFLVVVILLMPTLNGCAMLDHFKPIISVVGRELLTELDDLLTEYEQAEIPLEATVEEWLAFELAQNARVAKIESRLYHASLEAPADAVRPYRKRLRAVPTAGP